MEDELHANCDKVRAHCFKQPPLFFFFLIVCNLLDVNIPQQRAVCLFSSRTDLIECIRCHPFPSQDAVEDMDFFCCFIFSPLSISILMRLCNSEEIYSLPALPLPLPS